MPAATARDKVSLRPQHIIGMTMLVTMSFAWWWSKASLFEDRAVLAATIMFVAFAFVVAGVIITAVWSARRAYVQARGKWDFHIGWSLLALFLLGIAALIVWVLSGTGPVGLDQLPWPKLPSNIIAMGWRYGVPYIFALMVAFIPGFSNSSSRVPHGSTDPGTSHSEGGGLFHGMMGG